MKGGTFVVARRLGMVAVLTAAYAALVARVLSPAGSAIFSTVILTVLPFIAAVLFAGAARRHSGRERSGWWLACASASSWGLGSVVASAYLFAGDAVPSPSPADIGYGLAVILGVAAVLRIAIEHRRTSAIRRTLDAITISGSVFLVSWVLALESIWAASSGPLAGRVINLTYPISDIVIVSLVVFAVQRSSGSQRMPLMILGLGLALGAVADTWFAYLILAGGYRAGHPVEAAWFAASAIFVVAAMEAHPGGEAKDEAPAAKLRMHLPYIAAGSALALSGIHAVVTRHVEVLEVAAVVALLALVVIRQFVMVLENQAITISRLRSLDEMKNGILHAVSHELRTPLTYLQGTASFLQEDGEGMPADMRQEIYAGMVRNAERLEGLVSGLLDLERLTRGVIEPARQVTDVHKVLTSVVQTVNAKTHEVHVLGSQVFAHIDPGQAERIVENLIVNAVRHTPEGSTIKASAARVDKGVLIVVQDNGPGVSPDVRNEIFEPFVQTKDSRASGRGTGIGLSLVAKFAGVHGGRAWVEDADGGGARFCVFLADDVDVPDETIAA